MGKKNRLQECNQNDFHNDSPEDLDRNKNFVLDDLQIKTEIDAIGKRIDKIVETVEKIYPLSSYEKT